MPLRPAAFTHTARYVGLRIDPSLLQRPEVEPDFDWGFDIDIPVGFAALREIADRLGPFAGHEPR